MSGGDEFYIGYEPSMPPGMKRRVRRAVVAATAALLAVGVLVTGTQQPLARSSFEFGHQQTWTGILVRTPAPAILVPTPHGYRHFWLVGRGKHGVDAALGDLNDGWVQVAGTLISRDAWRMIEAVAVTTAPASPSATPPSFEPAGAGRPVSLLGEIVDSKCFLGVMNPGERVVHRDCALRCLSGGVPPMIAYHDEHGRADLAVLVDAHGRLLHDAVHDAVGRPVRASGRLFSVNGQPVFQLASLSGVVP